MFNGAKKPDTFRTDRIDTIIGEDAVFEGILNTADTARIDGTVKGEIKSEGMLIIGESGLVEGNIATRAILVAGTIRGNLQVEDRMEVAGSGRITGDVITKTLVIEEGASFEGKCGMGKQQPSDRIAARTSDIEKNEEASVYDEQGETNPDDEQETDYKLA